MKLEELYNRIYKHTRIYIFTLLCMHNTATYNIVAINNTVQEKLTGFRQDSHLEYICSLFLS